MARTLVDLDEDALRLAMAEYGTTTKVETVNRALREVANRREAAEEKRIERLMETAMFIGERLAECDVRKAGVAMTATCLVDTSAWELSYRSKQARQRLLSLASTHEIAICPVIAGEVLYAARNHADLVAYRRRLEEDLVWLETTGDAQERALFVQQDLARQGQHRGIGMVDLLIAATAEAHWATVLHYDSDYERIAELTGQQHEWIVPAVRVIPPPNHRYICTYRAKLDGDQRSLCSGLL